MNNFLSKLLGWSKYFPPSRFNNDGQRIGDKDYKFYWLGDIFQPLSIVLYVLMGLVAAAGAIYAIYLGIQLQGQMSKVKGMKQRSI